MARRIKLTSEASIELQEALLWYDNQAIGLGDTFFQTCQLLFSEIAKDPERHPKISRNFHRLVMQQFPYAIFYEFNSHEIIIVSLFNCSRDPQIWKNRIKRL